MITIVGNTVYFDVDDTLVMWNATPEELEKRGVEVTCPISTVLNDEGVEVPIPEWKQMLLPHRTHIEQIKKHKMRGHKIVVWSAGGGDWAAAAVKALGIEKFVDICLPKPTWVYDDLQPSEFIPKPQYMKDEA